VIAAPTPPRAFRKLRRPLAEIVTLSFEFIF
jgi:hypothetical protein